MALPDEGGVLAAERLLAASVRAGATRHVAAAVACGLWRAFASGLPRCAVSEEVEARKELIEPVLEENVRAALAGRRPTVSGDKRARRNFSEHALFGAGAEAVREGGKKAKQLNRAGKAKREFQGAEEIFE